MKKNVMMGILIILISLTFVGCGEKEIGEDVVENTNEMENNEMDKSETEAETETDAAEETEDSVSLEGSELINSLNTSKPEKMKIASGMKTIMSTYTDGNKVRTETEVEGLPKSILISLPDENTVYQYVYGETEGIKMTGEEIFESEDMVEMEDSDSLFEMIKSGQSPDMIVKKETLDGEEVVYIETTQSDDDMGNVLVKMWYSAKFATPLKYQVYMEDILYMELKVTEITDDLKMEDSLFSPPDDVNFTEMSLDTMFDNFDNFDDLDDDDE